MKRLSILFVSMAVMALGFNACDQKALEPEVIAEPDQIVFGVKGGNFDVAIGTKADTETSSNVFMGSTSPSFRVNVVDNSGSAPVKVYENREVSRTASFDPTGSDAPKFTGTMFWPNTDKHYSFYAIYPDQFDSGEGKSATNPSITITTQKDYIAAYTPYAEADYTDHEVALSFKHIYSWLGTVTVQAAENYTIDAVEIKLAAPKNIGTYNLNAGLSSYNASAETASAGWSALGCNPAAENWTIANEVGSENGNVNNLLIVPGTYTLNATWTIHTTEGQFTANYAGSQTVTLRPGNKNNLTVTLAGDAAEISLEVNVAAWNTPDAQSVNFGTTQVTS